MVKYIAKPNLNNNIGLKTFSFESDAIKYLEEYTGYEMSFEKNKKTGEKTDAEAIESEMEKSHELTANQIEHIRT